MKEAVLSLIPYALYQRIQFDLALPDTQNDVGEPRRPERTNLQPCSCALQKGIWMRVKSCYLPPGVHVGVLEAPIVILASSPLRHFDILAVDANGTVKVRQRNS